MSFRVAAWALILFACFFGMGDYPLLDDMEGMYAAIARDMLKSGQFIIPHLNGAPYLEKPPMLYWLTAASMAAFGVNTWAVRLVPALALFATAWLMKRFIARVAASETAGFAAALIMVTSLPLLVIGRMVLCDMVMTCFLSAALMGFYEWYADRKRWGLWGLYGFLALAVLTKGFAALILGGGSILLFLLWQRASRDTYFTLFSGRGMVLFLCIAAPWHIAASLQEPGFAWFYFINEHLYRFLNMREPHDYYTGHWWYYLPRILAYLLPWTPFLAVFLLHRGSQPVDSPPPAGGIKLPRFLWSWFLFCLLFFSLSGGKANYYIIAGMPALVMLLALRVNDYINSGSRAVPILTSVSLLLCAAALMAAPSFCHPGKGDFYPACEAASKTVAANLVFYGAIALPLCWRLSRKWLLVLTAAPVMLLLPMLVTAIDIAGERVSQKPVADFLNASGYADVALYQQFEKWSALAFYMDRPLTIVDSQSADLLYGQREKATPERFISLTEWKTHVPFMPLVVNNKKMDAVMASFPAHSVCMLSHFENVSVVGQCAATATID